MGRRFRVSPRRRRRLSKVVLQLKRGPSSPATKASPETSRRMKAVRRRGTEPELVVRRILRDLGLRYRTCPAGLPGRPDLADTSGTWCFFVHGCFWHGHDGCALHTVPKSNTDWWIRKVRDNRARDKRKERALRRAGFRVATIWQCQTRDPALLMHRIARFLRIRTPSSHSNRTNRRGFISAANHLLPKRGDHDRQSEHVTKLWRNSIPNHGSPLAARGRRSTPDELE